MTKTADGKKIYISPRNRIGKGKKGKGHYFEKFMGYAVAESVLEFLKRNMFDQIHLRITGGRETLISDLDVWFQKGHKYHKKPYEPQIVLPEKFMQKKTLTLSQLME